MSWSRQEVDAFLTEATRLGRLATVSGAGEPHVVPIWFRVDGERILIHTFGSSRKARDIDETGRFALTVDTEDMPYKGVALTGRAEVVGNDQVDSLELVRGLAIEHAGAEAGGGMGEGIAAMPGEHVALVLHPESWESWDFSQG